MSVMRYLRHLTLKAGREQPRGGESRQPQQHRTLVELESLEERLLFSLTPIEVVKLVADDLGADDHFGNSVWIDGDTAIVGSLLDDDGGIDAGAAYVFTRSGGTWTQQAKLTASDAAEGDVFGFAVAVSGDTAVVGAYRDDDAGSYSGSAYVFTRSGSTWTQQAKLTAPDAEALDQFGYSVAISGDTLLASQRGDDDRGNNTGAVYVFTRSGTTWTPQAKLTASDAATRDQFGHHVALSGDTALIGVPLDDDAGDLSGSAYVFTRNGTTWTQQAKLRAADAAAGDRFGVAVSLSENTAAVAAFFDDDGGAESGSAYVFSRAGTTWTEQGKLVASDAAAGDEFGRSVSVHGDRVVVGAIFDDDGDEGTGSAYVFSREGTTWDQEAKLTASDPGRFDRFGASVAVFGNTAFVGSFLSDPAGMDSGAAYVFDLEQPSVTLSVNDTSIAETGGVATFTATLSAASVVPVTVDLGFSGTATPTSDYTRSATQIVIPPGDTTGSMTVTAIADTSVESDETVVVDIVNTANAKEAGTQRQITTILDGAAAPTDIALGDHRLPENTDTTNAAFVSTISAIDPNAGDTHIFALVPGAGSANNGQFQVNGNELHVRAGTSLDHETQDSLSIRLRATDQHGLAFEKSVIIDVTDVNEAPSTLLLSSDSIAEDADTGLFTTVASLSAVDPDEEDAHFFSLVPGAGAEDNGSFLVIGQLLLVAPGVNLDHETRGQLHVRLGASDQGGLDVERAVVITVTDVNEAPTDILLDNQTIPNSTGSTTPVLVGNLTALDPDLGDSHTFALTPGSGSDHNSLFQVNASQLEVQAGIDLSQLTSVQVRIRGEDQGNLGIEKAFTIQVISDNQPPTDVTLDNNSINENTDTANAVLVGHLSAVDLDVLDTHTFALVAGSTTQQNSFFQITGDRLEIKPGTSLDHETTPSYDVRVRATDPGGLSVEKDLTIAIANLVEVEQVQIDDGTTQRSMLRSLTVYFDQEVVVAAGAFVVRRRNDDVGVVATNFTTMDVGGKTRATLTFSGNFTDLATGSLVDGDYELEIDAAKVLGNDLMDGDEDGVPGGNYLFGTVALDNFFRLFGDTDGGGIVDVNDFLDRFVPAFGSRRGDSSYRSELDADNDGIIGISDFLDYFVPNFGQSRELGV